MNKKFFEIKIPLLNANEDEVKIVELNFENYSLVKKNDNICSIESSKITQEILSEHDGYIRFFYAINEFVKVGEIVAIISNDQNYLKSIDLNKNEKLNIQITKKAQKLIDEHSLSISDLQTDNTIIKEKDVLEFIRLNLSYSKNFKQKTNVEKISPSQKEVSKNVKLSQNLNATTHMSVDLNRQKIDDLCNTLSKKLSLSLTFFDILLFNISKTLNEFPLMNSYLSDDNIIKNNDISVGFTVDRNNNLFMPVIKKVNEKKPDEIILEKLNLIRKVFSNKINVNDLSGGTISIATITEGYIKNHYPIIYPNQSTIIGIGSLSQSNDNLVSNNIIGITVAYDHRIINGNYCSSFISKLIKNIQEK
ncbi:MAG: hypothetical protein CMG00_00975 [Candidatus Marinimicrobia bacterium]|nr:hypothetical protein [Candidatus Neomarinimicrobiota bacterium]|tara:strand:- start:8399 stop:9487 length:1089 start_codon:yes stop_codon:yes gene_type:complete